MQQRYSIGLDFGTESARAVLVNIANGDIVASASHSYWHGVIDTFLPETTIALPSEYALQDPDDWCVAMTAVVHAVMKEARVAPEAVIGIGIDFTSCTILPTTASGEPLCSFEPLCSHPHAWPKLWKHHAAHRQAVRVTELAETRNEVWLARYGGKISAEWVLPKALQIVEEDELVYNAAEFILEGGDWIVWQLTGALTRNACAAGYKGTWHKSDGWVNEEYLSALDPRLTNLFAEKFAGEILPPGTHAGGLNEEWSQRLGLNPGTPVGAAIIDAHAACIGGGVSGPGTMYMTMGTSTCHMLMSESEEIVKGISGVVEGGIVDGLFGYEAGQSSVGDALAWCLSSTVPTEYFAEAGMRQLSLHELLTERAARLRPGASGLLALDWWNGCRTPLVDAELSGIIVGLNLATTPEEIYRAVIEATAFGTRVIIDTFVRQHVPVDALVAGGGLTRNDTVMQIYADVCNRSIALAGGGEASAVGAAILGAVAAGISHGGYESIADACASMAQKTTKVFTPNPLHVGIYNALFAEYVKLFRFFGEGGNNVMKQLRMIANNG